MTSDAPPRRHDQPIRTVGIVAKTHLENAPRVVTDITKWLTDRGVGALLETNTARGAGRRDELTYATNELPAHVDFMLVLGGDGTMLGVARGVAGCGDSIPVLAVNFGSLGVLTEVTLPELYGALESVIAGTAGIDERQMLRATVSRGSTTLTERLALNDVVIGKAALSSIIEFTVTVGEQLMTKVRADGVIIASPTGSTAHNLAAGGPIVHPLVDAMLLTPLAPHTLTNRPIVIPSAPPVHVTPNLDGSRLSAYVSFDGQSGFKLGDGDTVTIMRAERPLRVVRADARNYFAVLREKLQWGRR